MTFSGSGSALAQLAPGFRMQGPQQSGGLMARGAPQMSDGLRMGGQPQPAGGFMNGGAPQMSGGFMGTSPLAELGRGITQPSGMGMPQMSDGFMNRSQEAAPAPSGAGMYGGPTFGGQMGAIPGYLQGSAPVAGGINPPGFGNPTTSMAAGSRDPRAPQLGGGMMQRPPMPQMPQLGGGFRDGR
jgi:hypothetical protein